jgi:glucose/arabinose dehydrogenase
MKRVVKFPMLCVYELSWRLIMKKYFLTAMLGIVMTALALTGCEDALAKKVQGADFDFERHNSEKEKWETLNITSYQYTGKRVLDVLTAPVTVTVTPNGPKVIVLEEESAENAWDYGAATISDIFEAIALMVKEEAARATPRGETVISHIEYDGTYHYPSSFGVTRAKDGEVMDGGGHGIKITGFTELTD